MDPEESKPKEFCASCHVGSVRAHRTTYARWHAGQFIVIPGMLAWRCDFCGATFYDDRTLSRLILLLGTESDLDGERGWRSPGLDGGWDTDLGDRRRLG